MVVPQHFQILSGRKNTTMLSGTASARNTNSELITRRRAMQGEPRARSSSTVSIFELIEFRMPEAQELWHLMLYKGRDRGIALASPISPAIFIPKFPALLRWNSNQYRLQCRAIEWVTA
jgi:hypothetical protein